MSKIKNPIRKFINQAITEGLKQMYCGDPWAYRAVFEAVISDLRPNLDLLDGRAVIYIDHPEWECSSWSITPVKIATNMDPDYYERMAKELQSLAELCIKKAKRCKD